MRLSGSVLLFSAVSLWLTGVLFGLVPAWQAAQTNLNEPLKQTGRTGGPGAGHHRLRTALVIGEVALAVVLLTGMTLCARSLQQARKIDLGLDPDQVWAAGFRLPVIGYDDERTRHTYGVCARRSRRCPASRASPSRTGCHWCGRRKQHSLCRRRLSARSRRAHVCRHQHRLAALFRYLAHSNSGRTRIRRTRRFRGGRAWW